MSKKFKRKDIFGNVYWEDENGKKEYEKKDFFGNKYREDEDGKKLFEEKKGLFGNTHKDIFGNQYRTDEEGEKTYRKKDMFGRVYEEKDPCFFTTACTQYQSLPDDCHELQTLRQFRDNYVKALANGQQLIQEYYENSPKILSKIYVSDSPTEELMNIFKQVRLAVTYIEAGKNSEAFQVYKQMYLNLSEKYMPCTTLG